MEKTLGQIAYEAYWTQRDSGWNTQTDYQKEYYDKIAAVTVAIAVLAGKLVNTIMVNSTPMAVLIKEIENA